jgi:hypothetical protein
MRSGEDKKGYLIKQPKQWLVDIAPALTICLCILKVVVQIYGIPLPLPRILTDLADGSVNRIAFVDNSLDVLLECNESVADIKRYFEHQQDMLHTSDVNTIDDESSEEQHENTVSIKSSSFKAPKVPAEIKSLNESYDQLFMLLFKLENKTASSGPHPTWKPKYTGLEFVGPLEIDGSVAWISADGKAEFISKGKSSFKVPIK